MKKLLSIIIFVLTTVIIQAKTPQAFKYQAVVRNASGQLIADQQVQIKISIIENSAFGNDVCVEIFTTNTNAFGMVDLVIGSQNSSDFNNIDWGAKIYFVKVEIDPNGGSDFITMGTSQLLSVPYSLYANEAGNTFSGDYNDLVNKPNISEFDTNASDDFDGNYYNLTERPTSLSNFTNDVGFLVYEKDSSISNEIQYISISNDTIYLTKGGFVVLPKSASFSGSYNDLSDKPDLGLKLDTLNTSNWDKYAGDDFSGDYADLENKLILEREINSTQRLYSLMDVDDVFILGDTTTVFNPSNVHQIRFSRDYYNTKLFYNDEYNAFRVGAISNSTAWDRPNLGAHSIAMGVNNQASGYYSSAIGGKENKALGHNSIVHGGWQNTVGNYASIVGGDNNYCDSGSFIGGSSESTSLGNYSFIGGGSQNNINSFYSFIGGGFRNNASGYCSGIIGGSSLFARSYGEVAIGVYNTDYTPTEIWQSNSLDRLFVIGNGKFNNLNDALLMLKNGNTTVDGDWATTAGHSFTSTSDERLKENIETLKGTLTKLAEIRGVRFDWNELSGSDKKHDIGVIAQEIQAVFPELVVTKEDGYLTVDYPKLSAVLLQAIKEQQEQIITQQKLLDSIIERLSALENK